jgi:hypothetical protein
VWCLVSGPPRALVSRPAFTDERWGDALKLDVEYHRLDDRLLELVKAESKAEELRACASVTRLAPSERRLDAEWPHCTSRLAMPDQRDLIKDERTMAQPSD